MAWRGEKTSLGKKHLLELKREGKTTESFFPEGNSRLVVVVAVCSFWKLSLTWLGRGVLRPQCHLWWAIGRDQQDPWPIFSLIYIFGYIGPLCPCQAGGRAGKRCTVSLRGLYSETSRQVCVWSPAPRFLKADALPSERCPSKLPEPKAAAPHDSQWAAASRKGSSAMKKPENSSKAGCLRKAGLVF